MIKTEEIKVNERTYRVTQLPPSQALPLMGQVLKYGAPLLSSFSSMAKAYGAEDGSQTAAMEAISDDMTALDPDALSSLIIGLTKNIFSVDKSILIENPDMFFGECPEDMIPLAVKAAVFQFRPYLSGLGKSLNLKGAMTESESQTG